MRLHVRLHDQWGTDTINNYATMDEMPEPERSMCMLLDAVEARSETAGWDKFIYRSDIPGVGHLYEVQHPNDHTKYYYIIKGKQQ